MKQMIPLLLLVCYARYLHYFYKFALFFCGFSFCAKSQFNSKKNTHTKKKKKKERAARKAYANDCAKGLVDATGQTNWEGIIASSDPRYYAQIKYAQSQESQRGHALYGSNMDSKGGFIPQNENDLYFNASNYNMPDEQYYFLDKEGNSYGPFPIVKMALWYYLQFFNEKLRVRKSISPKYMHIKEINDPFCISKFSFVFCFFLFFVVFCFSFVCVCLLGFSRSHTPKKKNKKKKKRGGLEKS